MSAGDLAAHFAVSKPTMSAHFGVLREANLVVSDKRGKSVIYQLQMSVLEDALLAFAKALDLTMQGAPQRPRTGRAQEVKG